MSSKHHRTRSASSQQGDAQNGANSGQTNSRPDEHTSADNNSLTESVSIPDFGEVFQQNVQRATLTSTELQSMLNTQVTLLQQVLTSFSESHAHTNRQVLNSFAESSKRTSALEAQVNQLTSSNNAFSTTLCFYSLHVSHIFFVSLVFCLYRLIIY